MDASEEQPTPAPIVQATPGDEHLWGDLGDPSNPAVAAVKWLIAARDGDRDAFDGWSAREGSFDLNQIVDLLEGANLSSRVLESDDPTRLVCMRMIYDLPDEAVVIAGPMLARVAVLVLVRTGEQWRVLAVSDHLPSSDDVFGDK